MADSNIDTAALNSAKAEAVKKYVDLRQLSIVKEYIDKQDNLSINTESGVHNIRFYKGKLQYKNAGGNWTDISTSDGIGGSGEGGSITVDDMDNSVFASDNEVNDLFNF